MAFEQTTWRQILGLAAACGLACVGMGGPMVAFMGEPEKAVGETELVEWVIDPQRCPRPSRREAVEVCRQGGASKHAYQALSGPSAFSPATIPHIVPFANFNGIGAPLLI